MIVVMVVMMAIARATASPACTAHTWMVSCDEIIEEIKM
jgi:hypothetical protein